jgi:glycosyltransferase involved in cell wall biosynthesis
VAQHRRRGGMTEAQRLSALVVVHNEAAQLATCLERLRFADEIVVVLDRCTDDSRAIAAQFTASLVEGAWEREGDRRNTGIDSCRHFWILAVVAYEGVSPGLAAEIRATIAGSLHSYHLIAVDNYIGDHLVRWGWSTFGKGAYAGLFRKGAKRWGPQRVHPALTFTGPQGPALANRLDHHVDRNLSDMIRRLDRYSTARARDLRESGDIGSYGANLRRIVTRFWKAYVRRKGYREGPYGFAIALCAGLYPILSYLKARLEKE